MVRLFLVTAIFIIAACSTTSKVVPAILPRSAWNANEPRKYKSQVPVRITIHHEGTTFLPTADAAKKIRNIQIWGMGPDRKWSDIPYHFLISPIGVIYEGRDVFTAGETATEYDPQGHLLITCLGNLEEQLLPKEQLQSLINLTAYCANKYGISADSIQSHRDYSAQTTCPGKNLYKYISNGYIKKQVKKQLRKI
jgi:hypothetical protein